MSTTQVLEALSNLSSFNRYSESASMWTQESNDVRIYFLENEDMQCYSNSVHISPVNTRGSFSFEPQDLMKALKVETKSITASFLLEFEDEHGNAGYCHETAYWNGKEWQLI